MNDTSQNKTLQASSRDAIKGKKRDRSASESRLLKAAEDIFAKQGFKGATTRMIAKKAGVNESLIGRYFDGKMGLLIAIIENHVLSEDFEIKLNYPPQESLEAELLSFAKFKFERDCRKNFDFFRIVLSQAIVDQKFAKRIRESIPRHQPPELQARIENLKTQGKIAKDTDVVELLQNLDTFMFGNIISQRIILGISIEETAKNIESFIRAFAKSYSP